MDTTGVLSGVCTVYVSDVGVNPGLYRHVNTGAIIEVCAERPRTAARLERLLARTAAFVQRRILELAEPFEAASDIVIRNLLSRYDG